MKYIYTTTPLPTEGLEEIKELTGFSLVVVETDELIKTKHNPYFNQVWGDFDWMRSLFPRDASLRCYVTTADDFKQKGIVSHMGMYDMADGDDVHDFYFYLPTRKDKRATKNGFTTNLAWLFVHEFLHGCEKRNGGPDRTHDMEAQGRLKELLAEYIKKEEAEILAQLTRFFQYIKSRFRNPNSLQPLVERQAKAVMKEMELLGHPVRIVEGFRTNARQSELYAQGRTTPGNIVTYAKAGESFHNYGVAVDYVFIKEGYNAPDALWQTLGAVMKRHGFLWGGDWASWPDRPHGEMTLGYTVKDFQEGHVDYKLFM